jgi:hypothetical protein
MKKFLSLLFSSFSFLFTFTPLAHAAGSGSFTVNIGDETKQRVSINNSLGDFVQKSFSAVLLVAGLATFGYLVYGGVEWITSGGDKGKLESARNKITNGIIGLAIVASAWAVYRLIDYFLGIGLAK